MPARVSSGTYFPALPLSKRQTLLPSRRTSIKGKTRLPPLTKSQSTLTQLQFATPSSSRDVIDISSDDEYEEPKSSNKRRRSTKFDVRQPAQSSMTQFDRGEMADFLAKRRKISEPSSEDFDIWEDDEAEKWDDALKARQTERVHAMPWLRGDQDVENDEHEPEIPETSQALIEVSPVFDRSAETALHQLAELETPKKVRFRTEVPSSQTPPSTKCSSKSALRNEAVERSPLKDRSSNTSPVFSYDVKPESQNTSMWMLERVRLRSRNVSSKKRTSPTPSPEKVKSSQDYIERRQEASQIPNVRRLRKVETIQDSQVDDAGSMVEYNASPVTVHHASNATASLYKEQSSPRATEQGLSPREPPRHLCRASTIQDSQLDSSDALTLTKTNSSEIPPPPLQAAAENEDQACRVVATNVEDEINRAETFDDLDDDISSPYDGLESTFDRSQFCGLQSTYDPAYSALDRDAARFKWTQTQAHIDPLEKDEDEDEVETDVEDLDIGCELRVKSQVERSKQNLEPITGNDQGRSPAKASSIDVSAGRFNATDNTSHANEQTLGAQPAPEVVQVPSSPPPQDTLPDPSQASTVVPTQLAQLPVAPTSLPAPKSREHEIVAAPIFSVVSSPQKTCSVPLEMPSSSPLPLPPWSSPRNAIAAEDSKSKSEKAPDSDASLRSLADFSLPPPPPLSSGRSKR